MKRADNLLKWKKEGGGSLRFAGKLIKPNEVFFAKKEDIPNSFLDCVVCLSENTLDGNVVEEVQEEVQIPQYFWKVNKKNSTSTIKYGDIVDEKGKIISEVSLTKAEAAKIIKELS